MNRSYTATGMVQLPRLTAADAIALGTMMVTRSKTAPDTLPPLIHKGLQRAGGSLQVLSDAARSRIRQSAVDRLVVQEAKRTLDTSWSAAYHWCQGLARVLDAPDVSEPATRVRDILFADGLRFTTQRYKVQWVESQARLDLVAEEKLERVFSDLGGKAILTSIQRAHEHFGEALCITEDEPGDDVPVGTRLREFLDDLRFYVLRVVAYVEPGDPATRELADHLLAPLKTWKGPGTSSTDMPAEPEPEPDDIEVMDADVVIEAAPPALLSSPAIPLPDISAESSD